MRIAIVSYFPWVTQRLTTVVESKQLNQIAWVARNGQEAVNLCIKDTPDLVLMDLVMPVMDGVAATCNIMQTTPCAILLLTTDISSYQQLVQDAKNAGAIDVLNVPKDNPVDMRVLLNKIDAIEKLTSQRTDMFRRSMRGNPTRLPSTTNAEPPGLHQCLATAQRPKPTEPKHLVVIGASTGGPGAVLGVLQQLTADFRAPIVVVQHVEDEFVPSMVTWFDNQIALTTKVVQEADCPQIGQVLIMGGSRHLIMSRRQTLHYVDRADMLYHPSIDLFFSSVVEHWSGKIIGVLLTGIGWDGAKGLKQLRSAGNTTFAQNETSCVVYGMPKAAIEMAAADYVLTPEQIGMRLQRLMVDC